MNLTKLAFVRVVMILAFLLMIPTAPWVSENAGTISILLDRELGQDWKILPVCSVIPYLIVWTAYSLGIGPVMYLLLYVGEPEYPPRDENGRPMKASFGRSSPFRWVKQSDDKGE